MRVSRSRDDGSDCGASEALLTEADALVARSHAEYWLHQSCAPLDALPCADPSYDTDRHRTPRVSFSSRETKHDALSLSREKRKTVALTKKRDRRRDIFQRRPNAL